MSAHTHLADKCGHGYRCNKPFCNSFERHSHTPGPWRSASVAGKNPRNRVTIGGSREVCSLYLLSEEDSANARLIVAAPDLLAACKALLTAQEKRGSYAKEWLNLINAIQKAEGDDNEKRATEKTF